MLWVRHRGVWGAAAKVCRNSRRCRALAVSLSSCFDQAAHPTVTYNHKQTTLCYFSSTTTSNPNNDPLPEKIHIGFASQSGTAQLLAMQLQQALLRTGREAACTALSDISDLHPDSLYLFVVSTAGVGEFPDNGQAFYQQLTSQQSQANHNIQYALFGLGNSQAHARHYCAAGKALDQALLQAGHYSVLPLALGDDGDDEFFLEDAFDEWQEQVLQLISGGGELVEETTTTTQSPFETESDSTAFTATTETRIKPPLYPPLQLTPNDGAKPVDLLDTCPEFYRPNSQRLTVLAHTPLHPDHAGTWYGLHELQLALPTKYETGDHLLIYPRNPDYIVDAYLQLSENDTDPHAIVQGPDKATATSNYPHPTGISIYQTLTHCVDLQALPSPTLARWWTGQPNLDYRTCVVQPRRTVLDLILASQEKIHLQDLLYQLPPLQPRYYSIASSAQVHPDTAYLTIRPVYYVTTRGVPRSGLTTSYLQRLLPGDTVVGQVRANPHFRLSRGNTVVLIAGGCGVAPIRAFLEELLWLYQQERSVPQVHLFLGFREPSDQVYGDLIQQAKPFLATTRICHQGGCDTTDDPNCGLVSQALRQEADTLRPLLLDEDAHFYICGGARLFGAAVEQAMQDILSNDDQERLSELRDQGRWHEDLAD